MKDSVILGSGNSRYLKSVDNFKTLYPTYDDFVAALVAGTLPIDLNGINTAGFQQIGDGLSKNTLLKDSVAALYNFDENATPNDIFESIRGKVVLEATIDPSYGIYFILPALDKNKKYAIEIDPAENQNAQIDITFFNKNGDTYTWASMLKSELYANQTESKLKYRGGQAVDFDFTTGTASSVSSYGGNGFSIILNQKRSFDISKTSDGISLFYKNDGNELYFGMATIFYTNNQERTIRFNTSANGVIVKLLEKALL